MDPETDRLIKEAMRRRGQSFNKTLDQAIVQGLADLDACADKELFELQSSAMRLLAGHDPAHLNQLSDDLESQAFVDLTVRLGKQSGER